MKKQLLTIRRLFIAVFLGGLLASMAFGQEYNARDEFALTQSGTSGVWNYGYTANDLSNTFVLHTLTDTRTECGSPAERWNLSNSGDPTPEIIRFLSPTTCIGTPTDSLYVHPGQSGQRSVLRFVAPAAGTYQLTGVLQRANPSATTDIRILKNETTSLFTGSIVSTYQQAFNLTVTVAATDTIDFSVGFGNGSFNSDGSSLNVTVGQPANACLTVPSNLQVFVPGENSPSDVQVVNTNASLVGDATYTNMGKVGRAFDFDGSGDYVRIEDNPAQRPATAFTLEAWAKFDSTSGLPHIVGKPLRNSAFNSYALYLDSGQLRGLLGNNSGQYTRVFSNFTPQTGVWHHLAFTYDFSGGISTLRLFANGVEVTSGQDGTANLPLFYDTNPYPLLIGSDFENNNPQFFLDGQTDEVSIYGRALSQTEIFNLVKQGSFGKCQPTGCVQAPQNLVSWFAGEQNALDSRFGNHGTLFNGATFQTGKVGQGIKFDGVDDRVEIPDSASLKPQNLTIETWVKFDSLSSNTSGGAPNGLQYLVFKKNQSVGNFEGYSLLKTDTNRLRIGFAPGNGNPGEVADSTTVVTAGVYYHVVGTYDGSAIKLYVNGQLETTTTPYNLPLNYATTPLFFGTSGEAGFDGKFNGVLDETSIYNRALTVAEISSIYNAGSSGKCKPSPLNPLANQVAWFTGDGDTRDFTSLNSAGTLQGDTNYKVGKVGQSFNFDGNGDYITTADSPNWDFGTGNFAIEAWFNAPNPTGVQRIISAGSQADGGNNLWTLGYGDIGAWGGGQRLNFAVHNGGGSYSDFSSNPVAFFPNTWHHAAVVRSGTSFTFYLDGVSVGTVAVGAGYAINGGTTGAIIGARYNQNPASIFEFANGKLDEISVYKRALTGNEIAAVYNAGVAGKLKTISTPVNFSSFTKTSPSFAPTITQLADATVTFQQVTQSGTTSQSNVDLANLPRLPTGATYTGLAYDIATTANFTSATVCFNLPSLSSFTLSNLAVLHLEGGAWINRTASGNTLSNFCTSNLTSFSPFVIVQNLAPTASNGSVKGRVTAANGRGIQNVALTLTMPSGEIKRVSTNPFGYYRFQNLSIGETYILSVGSKRFSFNEPTRVITLNEDLTDVDFVSNNK